MPHHAAAPANEALPCQKFFSILEEKYPNHTAQIQAAQRALCRVLAAVEVAAPYVVTGVHHVAALKTKICGASGDDSATKIPLDDLIPLLLGLVFCFFGSSFVLLFTCLATLRFVCWDSIRENFEVLKENYDVACAENERDNLVDDDDNGIPDVQEINQKEYLSRKLQLVIKSIDVSRVNAAMRALLSGLMSVVATLRVGFAKQLTLSASLASAIAPYLRVGPFLRENVLANNEQQKLADLLEKVILHSVCFVISIVLSRFMYMLYCAVRGADLFVFFSLKLAIRQGWIKGEDYGLTLETMEAQAARLKHGLPEEKETCTSRAVLEEKNKEVIKKKFTISNFSNPKIKLFLVVVASMGFFFQLAHHDGLPFPFNVLLLPFTIAEFLLTCAVSIVITI